MNMPLPPCSVGQALDPDERVLDGVRREQERVLAHVELHARVQRQHHQLAGRVTGERDPAGAVGDRHDVRHAADRALHSAGRLEGGERDRLVFPEQHVVLEIDAVLGGEGDLGHGDQLAFDLAGARRELELGHVAKPWRLAPPGIADLVPYIERRTACHATGGPRLVLRAAPPTLDCFHGSKT
jgi:hypothetical protein